LTGGNESLEAIELENIVQDHEKRILALEQNYSEVKKEITQVQTSQSKIEGMLYSQNIEQKKLLEDHQSEQKKLLDTLLSHTLGIKKDSNNHKWGILAAAMSGGGIIALLVEILGR